MLRYAWSLVGKGIGQAGVASMGLVCHPLLAGVISAFGAAKWTLHSLYDRLIYYVVLRRLAKVPAINTFVARRIAGPGLSSTIYFQVRKF